MSYIKRDFGEAPFSKAEVRGARLQAYRLRAAVVVREREAKEAAHGKKYSLWGELKSMLPRHIA